MVSRWLPLYLVGIAALTLFPFAAPPCQPLGWTFRMGAFDFFANVAAFFPIGLALRRSGPWRTLALAFALSLTIELCQQWLPRQQDVTDLISNSSGAMLGWWLAREWRKRWSGPLFRPVTRNLLLRGAALAFLGAVAFQALTSPPHDFSNWRPFPIVIGNSAYGDRPWMGAVSELALYDRALAPDEETRRLEPDGAPALWAEGGPLLWLRFTGGDATGRADGPDGPIRFAPRIDDATFFSPGGLTMLPSGVRLDPWISDHVVDRLRGGSTMTLDLGLHAHVIRQHGPARIVSMGDGGKRRNFMLGQRSAGFVGLLRTPANGPGGARLNVRTRNFRVTGKPQQVRLVYDGSEAVLWVDGECQDFASFSTGTAPLLVGSVLGISVVTCTALGALAFASLGRRRDARALLALLGGAAAWGALSAIGVWDDLRGFETAALSLGVAAVLATLPILLKPPPTGSRE